MDKAYIIGATLIVYKSLLVVIGLMARKKTKSILDFFLGGKNIGPLITAISYSASNSSAWTLLGVSGIAYKFGLSTIWLVIGVIVGMFFNWLIVAPKLFRMTRSKDLITIPQFLVNEYQEKEKKTNPSSFFNNNHFLICILYCFSIPRSRERFPEYI